MGDDREEIARMIYLMHGDGLSAEDAMKPTNDAHWDFWKDHPLHADAWKCADAILARAQGSGPGEAVAWRRIDEHDGSPEPVFGICLTAYAPAPFETWFLDGAWRLYSQAEEKRVAGVMKWFPTHFVRKSDLFAIRGPGPGVAAAWPETMSPDVKGALELAFLKAKPLASHLAAPKLYQALRAAMIAATHTRELGDG